MIVERKYKKPPVVEALCEIYFAESTWDDTVVGRFYDRVKDDFPTKRQREIQEAQITFRPSGESAAGVKRLPPWMQFVSAKGDRLLQVARDLLVVNQLLPYPRFEDWEPAVYQAILKYREVAQPKGIVRLGLRYLNRVVVPGARIQMEDFFTIYPQLPRAVGDAHGSFLVRVEVPGQRGGHVVVITFGTVEPKQANEQAFLLDLYDILAPRRPLDFDVIQEEVRTAHDNVVAAFEGSLTDRLRDLFEPEEAP